MTATSCTQGGGRLWILVLAQASRAVARSDPLPRALSLAAEIADLSGAFDGQGGKMEHCVDAVVGKSPDDTRQVRYPANGLLTPIGHPSARTVGDPLGQFVTYTEKMAGPTS
jgi:hypothetical protein